MPVVNRQQNMIAFICDITGNPDLFIQPFDTQAGAYGKPRQIYAAPHATQGCPSFSPDGKQIAFVTDRGGTARTYIMPIPPEGAGLNDLTPKNFASRA